MENQVSNSRVSSRGRTLQSNPKYFNQQFVAEQINFSQVTDSQSDDSIIVSQDLSSQELNSSLASLEVTEMALSQNQTHPKDLCSDDVDQTDLKEFLSSSFKSPTDIGVSSNKVDIAFTDNGVQTDQQVGVELLDIEVQTDSQTSPLCSISGVQTDEQADKLFVESETQTDTQVADNQSHVEDMIDGLRNGINAFALSSNDKVDKLSETTLEMYTQMKGKLESIERNVKSQINESEGKKEIVKLNSELSELKITMMSEKDKWVSEKIEIMKANGNLRLKLEEAKTDYQEKMQVARESWQLEREKFQKENWSLNVEKKQESDTITKEPVNKVRYTDIKYTAGLNVILSSLGQCKLRWRNQTYESTELPYFLEKLFHINCPIDPEQQNKIADELIEAAKVGTLEVKKTGRRIKFP